MEKWERIDHMKKGVKREKEATDHPRLDGRANSKANKRERGLCEDKKKPAYLHCGRGCGWQSGRANSVVCSVMSGKKCWVFFSVFYKKL